MEQFVQELIGLAFSAAVTVVVGFIIGILKRVFDKYGLHLDAVREAQLKSQVRDIIVGVEEEYEALAKVKAGTFIAKSSVKLGAATARVLDLIPGITEEEAVQLVKQELPKVGLGASGFVRDVVAAATNKA